MNKIQEKKILKTQLFNYFTHEDYEGEHRLFAAVLNQAIIDGIDTQYVKVKKRFKKRYYNLKTRRFYYKTHYEIVSKLNKQCEQARKWTLYPNEGFEFYCNHLNLDIDATRKIFRNIFNKFKISDKKEIEKLNKQLM
jgi:hypothetical protein